MRVSLQSAVLAGFLILFGTWSHANLAEEEELIVVKRAEEPPIAGLSPKHKTAFLAAAQATDKNGESARAEVAEWAPLSKKAAEELRNLAATGWNFPLRPGGWKDKQAATDRVFPPLPAGFKDMLAGPPGSGMRELDVPGLGKREYYLAMPPGYKPVKNWPLIVSLHGAMHDPRGEGKCEYAVFWARFAGQWPGFVACPSGVPPEGQWFPEQQPFVMAMLADLKKNFAIDDDRIILHGLSNGGNGAWFYSMQYPSLWCGMVARSGCCPCQDLLLNLRHVPCLIIHGDKDEVIPPDFDHQSAAKLKELGYTVTYKELHGGHEFFFDQVNADLLPWLGKLKRNPYPQKITFRAGGEEYGRAYWVELANANAGVLREITAEVKERKIIELQAKNTTQLTLWLSDELVDLDQPVIVNCNGKQVYEGRVPRRGQALLEWLAATGDRAAAPVAKLSVKPE